MKFPWDDGRWRQALVKAAEQMHLPWSLHDEVVEVMVRLLLLLKVLE